MARPAAAPITAYCSVAMATSTRSMNRMRSSQAWSGAASSASVMIQVVVPSSSSLAACSIRPLWSRKRVSVEAPAGKERRSWLVMEWSQLSRSGPVIVTTPRFERSTIAVPREIRRCSMFGLP